MNTFKCFLKPTGHVLTTAAFTSAAINGLLIRPSQAEPSPEPPLTAPTNASKLSVTPVRTVTPPEAVSNQQFVGSDFQISQHQAVELSDNPLSSDINIPTSNSLPLNLPSNPDSSPTQQSQPSDPLPSDSPNSQTNPQSIDIPVNTPTDQTRDTALELSRQRLEDKLAQIVEQDRNEREERLRQTLMETATRYIRSGQRQAAHTIAQNPALSPENREDLLAMLNGQEPVPSRVSQPAPSAIRASPSESGWETASRRNGAGAFSQRQLSPHMCRESSNPRDRLFSNPGIGQQPPTTLAQSNQFSVGSTFLEGIGQQAPSILVSSTSTHNHIPASDLAELNTHSDCDEGPLSISEIPNNFFSYQWMPRIGQGQSGALEMIFPLSIPARITSLFGWRIHPISGTRRFHFGIDFGAPTGTPVVAALPGQVETSGYQDGYGLTVVIENGDVGQRNLYAHLSEIAVQPGAWVEQGAVIGWVGSTGNSTGPHLHFEVHQLGTEGWVAVDPMAISPVINIGAR
ncbi:MAG: peptidoglycan DD-metalloendopeptidase family protein [Elainellaceae cyanobacterium]